jgi:hypothetical protein
MSLALSDLHPGQAFILAGERPIAGEVVRVSEGWVLVKIRRGVREVEIRTRGGETVLFEREDVSRQAWARGTRVHLEEEVPN